MNKPPLLRKPYKAKFVEEMNMKITFSFDTFIYDMDSLNYFAEQRLKKKKGGKNTFEKAEKKKYDKIYKEAFIQNFDRQYADISFPKGAGMDVYIDCCRFLPDNVTVTKLIVRFVNSELTDILSVQGGRPELDSDIYNPVFNFRQELRAPSFDPTMMMCNLLLDIDITYITFDERGKIKQPRILGYSMFNLFVNKRTGKQPLDRSEQADSLLHDGLY